MSATPLNIVKLKPQTDVPVDTERNQYQSEDPSQQLPTRDVAIILSKTVRAVLGMGANVNIADVHNTRPLMNIVSQ